MEAYEKIARILRADKDTIRILEEKLSATTGAREVLEKIVDQNEEMIKSRLKDLGFSRRKSLLANDIYKALIRKIESDDEALSKSIGGHSCDTKEGCERISEAVGRVTDSRQGFFLKRDKVEEILRREPPRKILQFLKYKDIDELLENEDLFEVMSALRFLEGSDWLNEVFFKQYETINPDDFEEREIVVKALHPKWRDAAQMFVKKKYHNISHLKELGVIFIIPTSLGVPGELLRSFSLILHYINEIGFYSDIFRELSYGGATFSANLISLLRGDVMDERVPTFVDDKTRWLVIQRYLAKNDENDWRLFEPHVNPEAIHWSKAEQMLFEYGDLVEKEKDFGFWQNLNWVGDYYKTDTGIEVLVSFNIVDTAMSLVQERELVKYLYHHQESLWNKIFIEYFGREKMETLIKENILRGWFEI